jgi:hypothetical protein
MLEVCFGMGVDFLEFREQGDGILYTVDTLGWRMAFTLRYSVLLVDHAVSTRELITIVRRRRSRIPPNDSLSQILPRT